MLREYIDGQFQNDEAEEVGIGEFVTAAKLSESVARTREVPTTFLEDGSHVNDHIIRNPLTLTITGEVSDVYVRSSPAIAAVREAQAQVGALSIYLPDWTQTQAQRVSGIVSDVQNQIDAIDQLAETRQRFRGYVGLTGDEGKTNTERFIDFVDSVYNSDALIKIDAPFRTYADMAVTSFEYTRDNTTNSLSFTIEAQQFRFAQTIFVESAPAPAVQTNGQTDSPKDKGAQEGEEVEKSVVSQVGGFVGGLLE